MSVGCFSSCFEGSALTQLGGFLWGLVLGDTAGEPPCGPPPAQSSNHEGQHGESNGEGTAGDILGFVGKNQCSCGV